MNNGKLPAYPTQILSEDSGNVESYEGLTKREYFAAMAMQGFIAAWPEHAGNILPSTISEYAVRCADELLKQLEL